MNTGIAGALQHFLISYLQLIVKLLTDLFKLRIIADVAKWRRHSSASLLANWFGRCAHELFTDISSVTASNHPSVFEMSGSLRCLWNPNAWLCWESGITELHILPLSGSMWSRAVCGRAHSRSPTLCGRESERGWRVQEREGDKVKKKRQTREKGNIYSSVSARYHIAVFQIESLEYISVYFVAIYWQSDSFPEPI